MDNWKNIGIAGDQDNIFLSATMTGNLQLDPFGTHWLFSL